MTEHGPVVVAHLSDLHVGEPDSTMEKMFAPSHRVRAAVAQLAGMGADLGALVLTGDLVDRGTTSEYRHLLDLLAPLEVPVVAVAGNHDDPAQLAAAAPPDWFVVAPGEPGTVVEDLCGLRVVVVDSTVPDLHSGLFDDDALAWLDATLSDAPGTPTVVATHHPPLEVGMWWMDYGSPPGSHALVDVLGRHDDVIVLLAGHIHRSTQAVLGSTLVSVAGSLAYQSVPATGADPEPSICDDVADVDLLRWDGTTAVVQHVAVAGARTVVDLRQVISPWPPYEEAARAGGPMPK